MYKMPTGNKLSLIIRMKIIVIIITGSRQSFFFSTMTWITSIYTYYSDFEIDWFILGTGIQAPLYKKPDCTDPSVDGELGTELLPEFWLVVDVEDERIWAASFANKDWMNTPRASQICWKTLVECCCIS